MHRPRSPERSRAGQPAASSTASSETSPRRQGWLPPVGRSGACPCPTPTSCRPRRPPRDGGPRSPENRDTLTSRCGVEAPCLQRLGAVLTERCYWATETLMDDYDHIE